MLQAIKIEFGVKMEYRLDCYRPPKYAIQEARPQVKDILSSIQAFQLGGHLGGRNAPESSKNHVFVLDPCLNICFSRSGRLLGRILMSFCMGFGIFFFLNRFWKAPGLHLGLFFGCLRAVLGRCNSQKALKTYVFFEVFVIVRSWLA